MKSAVFIFIVILGVGCGTSGGQLPAGSLIKLEQRSDGLVYRKVDNFPYTGQHVMRDVQGKIQYVSNYENGVRHGEMAVYFPNGQRRANAEFNKGKLVSGITWKPNGTEGSRVVNGTGTFLMFHSNGDKARESVYVGGVRVRRTDFPADGSTNGQ